MDAETLHHDTTSMAEIGGKVGDSAGTQHPWLCSPATVLQRNITSRHSPASMVAMAVLQRSIPWRRSPATVLQRSINGGDDGAATQHPMALLDGDDAAT